MSDNEQAQELQALNNKILQLEEDNRELRETIKNLRSIISQSIDGIAIINEQGEVIEWNPSLEAITGISSEQVLGKPFWEVQYQMMPSEQQTPETLTQLRESIADLLKTGQSPWLGQQKVYKFQHPDGGQRFVQMTIFPIQTERGFKLGSITRDVTKLKFSEQALLESEARHRIISETISDYAYSFRVNQDGSLYNEWLAGGFEKITGYSSEELDRSVGWASLIHPEDMPIAQQRFKRLMEGHEDVSEFRIKNKQGEIRWLRDYGAPEWDENQQRTVRIIGAVQDITESKRAEKALRESQEITQNYLDIARVMLIALDTQQRVTMINPKGCEILGYSQDEILGQNWFDKFIPQEDSEQVKQVLTRSSPVRSSW